MNRLLLPAPATKQEPPTEGTAPDLVMVIIKVAGTNSGGTSASPDHHLGEDDDLPSGRDNSDADDENSIGTGSRCSDYSSGGDNLDYGSQGEY